MAKPSAVDLAMELVKEFEGLPDGDPSTTNLDPYMDPVGNWTVGWGHLVRDEEGRVLRGEESRAKVKELYPDGITVEEAEALLRGDVEKIAVQIDRLVAVPLNVNEKAALVSLAFNIGIGAFARSTLLRKLNGGDKTGAADEFLRWVHADGKRLPGLVERRRAERLLFLRPIVPKPKKPHQDKAIIATATAAATTGAMVLADVGSQMAEQLPMFERIARYLHENGSIFMEIIAVIAFVGTALGIYFRVRQMKDEG